MTKSTGWCSEGRGLDNVWVRIDTTALSNNARAVLSLLSPSNGSAPALMAVVKANGYGHGTANAALAFKTGGATWFGVTSLAEAQELIDAGIDSLTDPILVFSPLVTREQCEAALRSGLHITVCDLGHIELLDSVARDLGLIADVHLKLDTGMSRLGLLPEEALAVAVQIAKRPTLHLTAVYTHFATAFETRLAPTEKQLEVYTNFVKALQESGVGNFLRHTSNSAALLRLPSCRLDIVRAGTILYGQYPGPNTIKVPQLNANTFRMEARVVFVHDLPAGVSVGYGAEYKTTRPTRAAVIPVGFADGVTMQPASVTKGIRGLKSLASGVLAPRPLSVTFGAFRARVLGRVAMQMLVVDITDSPTPINAGDVATVPARRLAVRPDIPRIISTFKDVS